MSGRSLSSTTILSFLALLNMESRVFRLYHTSAQTCNFRIDSYAYCTHTYPKPDSVRYSLAYSHNSYSIPSYSSRTLLIINSSSPQCVSCEGHSPTPGSHTRGAVARINVDRRTLRRDRIRHPAAVPRRLLLYAEREPGQG